jgi:hypothetical protein
MQTFGQAMLFATLKVDDIFPIYIIALMVFIQVRAGCLARL